MKIRIQGNTIRFRLKQFEVEQFKEEGAIKASLEFGDLTQNQLQFIIATTSESRFSLKQNATVIQLFVPNVTADEWTSTELVGFNENIITENGKEVSILVEKDFKCLDRSDEDEVGSYPNPLAQCDPAT